MQKVLYQEVAERIEKLIQKGSLKLGDKLLSVRALSQEQGVSLSTAYQTYYYLESKGLIEAKPQSGYYVKFSTQHFPAMPSMAKETQVARPVSTSEMIEDVYQRLFQPGLINLAVGSPGIPFLPVAKLSKAAHYVIRKQPDKILQYEEVKGNANLRLQIARLSFNWGGAVGKDDVVITAGCVEALSLAIKAVTQPGDAVAIESPTYHAIFQIMESQGLKVVEIPCDPQHGIDLQFLENAITRFAIKACLFVPNFNNPIGSCMPDANKKKLVELLASKEIPLIEDDIYGELYFGTNLPRTCKSFDKKGMVIYCSSFSKSLAPGYRLGYTIAGKFTEKIIALKRMHVVSTNTLAQAVIAHFLEHGRYELHLRNLRKNLHSNWLKYMQVILASFPESAKISRPSGGFVIWIELNKQTDVWKIFNKALKQKIGFVPGEIFSASGKFSNCLRLSFGEPLTKAREDAIKQVGRMFHHP
ncbi:MAG: PLP-dependent aminotransferase family protein [Chryseotalea sp.]|jgi:DNA-binding transcriptional MocR family regulator